MDTHTHTHIQKKKTTKKTFLYTRSAVLTVSLATYWRHIFAVEVILRNLKCVGFTTCHCWTCLMLIGRLNGFYFILIQKWGIKQRNNAVRMSAGWQIHLQSLCTICGGIKAKLRRASACVCVSFLYCAQCSDKNISLISAHYRQLRFNNGALYEALKADCSIQDTPDNDSGFVHLRFLNSNLWKFPFTQATSAFPLVL